MSTNTIVKSLNEELRQATFVVLVPDEVDLHGDVYDEATVRDACHSFNRFCRKANLFHFKQTELFDFAESYISPVDLDIEGHLIKKGTWLAVTQVYDDTLWEMIKNREIVSVSIGALAKTEKIDD